MVATQQVLEAFGQIAQDPDTAPFSNGLNLALEVGYSQSALEGLPEELWRRFCGLSAISEWMPLSGQERVLEVGCGVGLDCHTLAERFPGLQVVGLDGCLQMLQRAPSHPRIEWVQGLATRLPFPSASFEVVFFNGLLNLNSERARILQEMQRVLAPGGHLYGSEIVLTHSGSPPEGTNWYS
jgi:ubiquinone/menaquinone biosynthesis C-methylase UbiE